MKTFLVKILLLLVVITGVLCPSVGAEESKDPTAITLEIAVHFLAPDGSDVLIQTGAYRVEVADNGLQLIPSEGNARLIGAEVATHDEDVGAPLAVSLAGEEKEFKDLHMVMLLLPGGQSLEAAGSFSGLRERALQMERIRTFKLRAKPMITQAAGKSPIGPAVKYPLPSGHLVGLWIADPEVRKAQKSSGNGIGPVSMI